MALSPAAIKCNGPHGVLIQESFAWGEYFGKDASIQPLRPGLQLSPPG